MKIVVLKPDGIGDYLLFRNYLNCIKRHYGSECRIIGILNPLLKGFADVVDRDIWGDILWFSQKKAINSSLYRAYWRLVSCGLRSDIAIYPVVSRVSVSDWLMSQIPAKQKIASQNDLKCMSQKRTLETDQYYNLLIPLNNNRPRFEFYSNRDIISGWLGERVKCDYEIKPEFLPKVKVNKNKYAVIFPGAGEAQKIWPNERYGEVCSYIISQYQMNIIVAGSRADDAAFLAIKNKCIPEAITSFCGKLNYSEVARVVSNASVVLCNDSGAMHLAAALKVPFIMISSSRDYGRFHPYPVAMNVKGTFVYPPECDNWPIAKETMEHIKFVHNEAKPRHKITDVNVNQVICAVDNVMTQYMDAKR
jgi:ADP-heptose:LPS heptosyltransferase